MAIAPQFKPKSRRRDEPALVQNVYVSSQKASRPFGGKLKPLIRIRIGGSAPQRTQPQRSAELNAREARLLARELLARADEIDESAP